MRSLEITIFILLVITSTSVLDGMGIVHNTSNTCTTSDCQARAFIYNMTNMSSIQEVSLDTTDPASMAWTSITLGLNFIIFAVFWGLYILALIVLVGPALQYMFGVPAVIATWLMVGVWILWIIALIQIKRGGLGFDTWR